MHGWAMCDILFLVPLNLLKLEGASFLVPCLLSGLWWCLNWGRSLLLLLWDFMVGGMKGISWMMDYESLNLKSHPQNTSVNRCLETTIILLIFIPHCSYNLAMFPPDLLCLLQCSLDNISSISPPDLEHSCFGSSGPILIREASLESLTLPFHI